MPFSKDIRKKEANRNVLKEIQNKLKGFSKLFKWILRNKGADQLARQALQQTIEK